jgi:hypothetical protein
MEFYKIGALKVFADLGALIEEDELNQINFSDLPAILPVDIIQVIKSHVSNLKGNKEEYNLKDNKEE